MKKFFSLIAVLTVISIAFSSLTACGTPDTDGSTSSSTATDTQASESTDRETDASTEDQSAVSSESDTASVTEAPSESEENNDKETQESDKTDDTDETDETDEIDETDVSLIDGEYADQIENAHELKNGVQAGFTDSKRDSFWLENAEMKFTYALGGGSKMLVSSINNKKGAPYITDTMDVFVKMSNGDLYYTSGSTADATANLYRIGMYYYEARFEEQNFLNSFEIVDGDPIEGWSVNKSASNNIKLNSDGSIIIASSSDPYVVLNGAGFSADDYNMIKLKIRAVSGTKGTCKLYLTYGEYSGYSGERAVSFSFSTDGEYNEIYVPLYNLPDYKGNVNSLRFDVDGSSGDCFEIAEITPSSIPVNSITPTDLSLCRSFYVYTDKMHHSIQIAATDITKRIDTVGILTEIDKSTVSAIVVKDAKGLHYSLDDVDWDSAQYVGFNVTGTGIFGYILPVSDTAGKLNVYEKDDKYVIEQTRSPKDGAIKPSEDGTLNANDFVMSQRIYTDDSDSFDEFIKEAEIERNPLSSTITVTPGESTEVSFAGYDPVRGIYVFNVSSPAGFGAAYYTNPNRYYSFQFNIKSIDTRDIYVMALAESGALECSVVLTNDNVLLPIPVAVCKNFTEKAGERNLYNIDDDAYSEAFIPLKLTEKSRYSMKIVNLYQNWGQYPLKQISSIQFRAPYYHLSTGVTESNCILPWYNTKTSDSPNTLPDFRAMSAPLWEDQPQRNSGGAHSWLEYTDSDGNYSAAESYANYIDSNGPTYADVVMENLSYDGRIRATYTHLEMPQTDENRTYYEIRYEVLEDISIADFKSDFTIYTVTDNEPAATADYRKIGYLNEDNECTVTKSNLEKGTVKEYVLGTNCPYFSMFDMPADASPDGYTNVAFLIYQSEIVIGGEENDSNFIIINEYNKVRLSLDMGAVELKAGDSFTINAILLPWGSHESDYTDGDVNVREVRKNTLLDPLTITSDTDEIIESVYLPKIRSTDGKTVTFTLSGGHNNVAVRAYGFDTLTVPVLYELIDGEWVKIEINSAAQPDKLGYYHHFDGYNVLYDGDGTYSYSFVTAMDNGKERTFKLDASEIVKALPDSGRIEAENYLDMYYDPTEIDTLVTASSIYNKRFSNVVLAEDASYVSLYANNVLESFFMVKPDSGEISGQYIVVKYRIPTTNTVKLNNFEFFFSSVSVDPVSGENVKYDALVQDGEWHVVVIDAASFPHPSFKPDENGKYAVNYIRFDVINRPSTTGENYVDIGFFGMCDTLDEICELTRDEFETIEFFSNEGSADLVTKTGLVDRKIYIAEDSGYTKSELSYYGLVDSVNDGTNNQQINVNGNHVGGIAIVSDLDEISSTTLTLKGWNVIEGGTHSYMWSADGGHTWNTATPKSALASASDTIINHCKTKLTTALGTQFNFEDAEASKTNAGFQNSGLAIDLSAYSGQTVDLVFASVPQSAPNTLCLIFCIEGISVP